MPRTGRPTKYRAEIGEQIGEQIADAMSGPLNAISGILPLFIMSLNFSYYDDAGTFLNNTSRHPKLLTISFAKEKAGHRLRRTSLEDYFSHIYS
jgi:hypothetical protein